MHTSPTPPANDLAFLLKLGTDYAESAMRKLGSVPPALFAITPQGALQFVPRSLEDERAKNDFANTARLICAGYEAAAALVVLESWMKVVPPGQPHDPDESPSEALDRHEIVLLMAESREAKQQKVLRIVRTDAGGFFGLSDFEGLPKAEFQGCFSQMLPPKQPTPEMVKVTKAVLAVMGVTAQTPRPKTR